MLLLMLSVRDNRAGTILSPTTGWLLPSALLAETDHAPAAIVVSGTPTVTPLITPSATSTPGVDLSPTPTVTVTIEPTPTLGETRQRRHWP